MRTLLALVFVAACGGKDKPPEAPDEPLPDPQAEAAPQTELERRRDVACEALGPKLTACAVEDARRTMSAKELAELDLERTAPVHTRKFVDSCQEQQLSSRQVRVYEVCLREETACEPLIACLGHARPEAGDPAPATP